MPSQRIINLWKKEKSWIVRYINSSWDVNMILCGKGDDVSKKDSIWMYKGPTDTKKKIAAFRRSMNRRKQVVKTPKKLYRGTAEDSPSPTMNDYSPDLKACSFVSTTESRSIAKEFAWPRDKGYLHVLDVRPGVHYYDFVNNYGNDKVSREEEVLLYPGSQFEITRKRGKVLYWKVTNGKKSTSNH